MRKRSTKAVRTVEVTRDSQVNHKAPKTASKMRGPVRTSSTATRTPGVGGPSGRSNTRNSATKGIRTGQRHDIKL
jgi:hypothetical protein